MAGFATSASATSASCARRTTSGEPSPASSRHTSSTACPSCCPLYEGGPFRPAFVQSGILVYSTIARSRLHWLVSPNRARRLVPPLRVDGLRSCALYADAWTNDARLCLANVRAAADAGATVLNGAEVVRLRTTRGVLTGAEVRVDGEHVTVNARVCVNAAGPVGRRGAPARESFCGDLGTAQQGSTRARRRRRHVEGGADGAPGRRPRDLRRALVRDAPARDDRHDLERRSRRRRRRRRRT